VLKVGPAAKVRDSFKAWVLCDWSGAHHPLSPVIELGIRHPRKKDRNKEPLGDGRMGVIDALVFFSPPEAV